MAVRADLFTYRVVAANNTNAANIKASTGRVHGWTIWNGAAAARFVKLYNKAAAPTVGTDTPFITIGLAATSRADFDDGGGISFPAGIGIGIVNLVADSDTTAPTAGDVVAQIFYS